MKKTKPRRRIRAIIGRSSGRRTLAPGQISVADETFEARATAVIGAASAAFLKKALRPSA